MSSILYILYCGYQKNEVKDKDDHEIPSASQRDLQINFSRSSLSTPIQILTYTTQVVYSIGKAIIIKPLKDDEGFYYYSAH